jgi:hypothetical protein
LIFFFFFPHANMNFSQKGQCFHTCQELTCCTLCLIPLSPFPVSRRLAPRLAPSLSV